MMQANALEHLFLISKNETYRYEDLYKVESFLDHFLSSHEVSEAHPLGIWADSSDLTIFLIAACWNRHIPFVCFNPRQKSDNLKKQRKALQPKLILCDASASPEKPNQKSFAVHPLDLRRILAGDEHHPKPKKEIPASNKQAIFSYFFTSGTSGSPKIVPLKRRQMQVAARASAQNMKPKPDHCWLLCMPLHHVGGVTLILRSLLYGAAIYRMPAFQTTEVASLLARDQRISAASLVPTMLKRLLDLPSFTTHAHFQGILLGGGPISPDLLQVCLERGIPVIPSFGMTETCAQIAANPVTAHTNEPNVHAVGKIFKPNRIEIRDETGQAVEIRQPGSIWLKGPQLFDGYLEGYGDDKAIDANGWFNTGDFGRLDETGNLYVEARRTDLIITGGENVSPFEVEHALEALPEVKEAAVVGVKDEEWGQRVAAVVVIKTQQHDTEEVLRSALQDRLPPFKIPKQLVFVDELPRTSTGKIRRAELLACLKD